jgi:hypothetical protein
MMTMQSGLPCHSSTVPRSPQCCSPDVPDGQGLGDLRWNAPLLQIGQIEKDQPGDDGVARYLVVKVAGLQRELVTYLRYYNEERTWGSDILNSIPAALSPTLARLGLLVARLLATEAGFFRAHTGRPVRQLTYKGAHRDDDQQGHPAE